jgi:hypothetical protein
LGKNQAESLKCDSPGQANAEGWHAALGIDEQTTNPVRVVCGIYKTQDKYLSD